MKRITLLLLCVINFSFAFSQIKEFTFDGSKTYPNGSRIAYFTVEGITDNIEAMYVQNQMKKTTGIYRIHIYSGTDKRNCMIDCSDTIAEKYIYQSMNRIISACKSERALFSKNPIDFYIQVLDIKDFPKNIETGNKITDLENYKIAIKNWGITNPEKYKIMQEPIEVIVNKHE